MNSKLASNPSQRCGVLACSSAQRLKPEGIYVPKDIDVKNWFLAPSDDLRSSNMLEIVASEFKVQGLEIDWALVCWDADLRRSCGGDDWDYYSFRGTKWNKRNKPEQQRYLLNSYRVLLTRARQIEYEQFTKDANKFDSHQSSDAVVVSFRAYLSAVLYWLFCACLKPTA